MSTKKTYTAIDALISRRLQGIREEILRINDIHAQTFVEGGRPNMEKLLAALGTGPHLFFNETRIAAYTYANLKRVGQDIQALEESPIVVRLGTGGKLHHIINPLGVRVEVYGEEQQGLPSAWAQQQMGLDPKDIDLLR